MPVGIANPYANLNLLVPEAHRSNLEQFSSRFTSDEGEKKDIDRSPFARYVDFWWAAIGVGYREGRLTDSSSTHKFVTGVIFNSDPWRIIHLELLAIAHTDSTDVLKTPGKVIDIANGYAATGLPLLVEKLVAKVEPIWDLSNYLRDIASGDGGLSI